MKVAILSDYSRIGGVTGDCVQANKTADALHRVGVTVLRCYIRPSDSQVYGPRGELRSLGSRQTPVYTPQNQEYPFAIK